jgi:hypothetical protein
MFLPKIIQRIAVILPPYHLSQLAFHLVGSSASLSAGTHWETLIGFTMLCLGIAYIGHQRDQRAHA